MNTHKKSVKIGHSEVHFETGKVARQANGAVIVRAGDTMILATACAADKATENIDFLPLRVDYQEKFSSAGKTLGGFIKREGRPTERETLVCRLIDRPLRPMFEEGYFNETQVLTYVWSYDGDNSPEPLAICAASAALAISDIPLIKPIGAVRVGYIDGKFVINPHPEKATESQLDLILAGTDDAVLMIEGYCNLLTEVQVLEAVETGHKAIKEICHTIDALAKEVGKSKNRSTLRPIPQEVIDAVDAIIRPKITPILHIAEKLKRDEGLRELEQMVKEALLPEGEEPKYTPVDVKLALKKVKARYMRQMVLDEKVRVDGRSTTDIRPITIEQSFLPRTHGSSLFTRGETQSVAVCTLGGDNMGQRYETIMEEGTRHFYLQYFFPPFSV